MMLHHGSGDAMSKYQPLESFLAARDERELPMTFAEVEALLGFHLPPSARSHPQWWSNNLGSHVAVRAWRGAGWRTSRVDVAGERVVFVRDAPATAPPSTSGEGDIHLRWTELGGFSQKLIREAREKTGRTPEEVVDDLLMELSQRRRRELLESFRARWTGPTGDSVDMIREDRDSR
jgi:hypothetical protein